MRDGRGTDRYACRRERRRKTEADPIGKRRAAYRETADPTFETYGPKTDAEYDALIAERGSLPA